MILQLFSNLELAIVFGFFGLIVGSFVGVLVSRAGTGMSALSGRSKCFSCARSLGVLDLIPFFSFLVLRGKCRKCNIKIPIADFLIETSVALLFFWIIYTLGLTYYSGLLLLIASVLAALAAYDIKHMILLDKWTALVGFLGFLGIGFSVQGGADIMSILTGMIVPSAMVLVLGIVWRITHGKLFGLGDVKLLAAFTLWIGSGAVDAFVIGIWLGGSYGILLYARRFFVSIFYRKKINYKEIVRRGEKVPMGPFLIGGALLFAVAGATIEGTMLGFVKLLT